MKRIFSVFLKIFIFLFVAAVFVILILFGNSRKKEEVKSVILPSVVIQKPEVRNITEAITISGYVEAKDMIPVVPFVSGTIMKYPVKAGDYVTKNTLLAKIDDAPFRQQMLQAQAAYTAAKSTFDRIESLFRSGAATQQNYDQVKAQYEATKAQYDLAKLQMDYTEVRAPVAGTVLIANQAVGSIGAQGTPVVILANLDNQVVRLKVPEKYFDLFTLERANLKVTVTRPAEKNLYEDAVTTASIENIAPYISPESKNFEVVCKLDEPGERFRPGMYVKVQVAYKTYENVYVLPMQTKKLDGSVYTYDSENKTVHYMEIDNSPQDGLYFMVDQSLKDTFFVTDGQNFVFDGQEVKLYSEVLSENL